MINPLKILSCSFTFLSILIAVCAFALAAALYSEVALGLEPCILCIYQRIPFALVILFGLVGIAYRKHSFLPRAMVGLSGLALLINSGIAFYHTGVEQKWWKSAVEGCAVPNFETTEVQSILENIMSAPTASCADIPWQDPFIGLSMANYNVLMCLGLCIACALSVWLSRKSQAC